MTKKSRLGPRQLHSLAELPREQMLDELAIGLPIIARSARQLSATAQVLPGDHAARGTSWR